jgi:hypothetical protein
VRRGKNPHRWKSRSAGERALRYVAKPLTVHDRVDQATHGNLHA